MLVGTASGRSNKCDGFASREYETIGNQYMPIAPGKQINTEATEMQGAIGVIFTGRAEHFG